MVGGSKVKIRRARVRTTDGKEVKLKNYEQLHDGRALDELAFERMLLGVASRHYGKVEPDLAEDLEAYGSSKSAVNERFAHKTGELLQQFLDRKLDGTRFVAVYVDAIFLGGHAILVALGVDLDGKKHVLGMREGATENAAVCTALMQDLVARGLDAGQGLLFVVDGTKRFVRRLMTRLATGHSSSAA